MLWGESYILQNWEATPDFKILSGNTYIQYAGKPVAMIHRTPILPDDSNAAAAALAKEFEDTTIKVLAVE